MTLPRCSSQHSADSVIGKEQAERIRPYLQQLALSASTVGDIATTIYQVFLNHLLRNIYADEMGEDIFHDFCVLVNVPLRVTARLLHENTSRVVR